jgi:hypothetical protein
LLPIDSFLLITRYLTLTAADMRCKLHHVVSEVKTVDGDFKSSKHRKTGCSSTLRLSLPER